jgi:hypothetical protein
MKVFQSAALMLLSASATMAFAPASMQTASRVGLSMANDDNCDDRRSFVSKVSISFVQVELNACSSFWLGL